jgi:hypothetical protein
MNNANAENTAATKQTIIIPTSKNDVMTFNGHCQSRDGVAW